ncbi:helix-turn-helix domain-containing protein, partial [Undibacterium sp. CCC2.1]
FTHGLPRLFSTDTSLNCCPDMWIHYNYLGLRLESISRALCRLEREGLIEFKERGRREISIPNLEALSEFIRCARKTSTFRGCRDSSDICKIRSKMNAGK